MRHLRRHWRRITFALTAVLFVGAGVFFRAYPSVEIDYGSALASPLDVRIYTGSPGETAKVRIDVATLDHESWRADVYVAAKAGTKVLVTASRVAYVEYAVPPKTTALTQTVAYATRFTIPKDVAGSFSSARDGYYAATFDISRNISSLDNNRIVTAALPSINKDEYFNPCCANLLQSASEGLTTSDPGDFPGIDSRDYTTVGGKRDVTQLWWGPSDLKSSVFLRGSASILRNADLKINYPGFSSVRNGGIEWTGGYGLSPALVAVDRGLEDARSRNDFLSGLFLALGASALLALVQERPDPSVGTETPEPLVNATLSGDSPAPEQDSRRTGTFRGSRRGVALAGTRRRNNRRTPPAQTR